MLLIPLQAVPSQTSQVQLAGQNCQITVSQKRTGMFFTLSVNQTLIIAGVLCENLNRLVRSVYLGFVGDFVFNDTQGDNDPYYTGLGGQYQLIYLESLNLPSTFSSTATKNNFLSLGNVYLDVSQGSK